MRRTCQFWVLDDDGKAVHEVPCGKPAVAHITWPGGAKGGTTYWYCAEHYDLRLGFVRKVGRQDVLEASGVRP